MTPRFLGAVALAPLLLLPPAAAAHGDGGLEPGEFVVHQQDIPVRVLLIGFREDQVDTDQLLAALPETYKPVVRFPRFYGLEGRDLGLEYHFKYRVERKSAQFAGRLFAYLQRIGVPGALTGFQALYNSQTQNVLDVTGPVLYVDAPRVERWLAENAGRHEDERGYTIAFINWHGQPGFKFHVYTKTDQPDPDTGHNFGAVLASRKLVAWGGTSSRTWFYDFSAGPEAWANNWNVDNADLDGNGVDDYRIPPIWEYAAGGHRPPAQLSFDMGQLARFVAINLLFTSSPLYDPLVTAPDVAGAKVAHTAMLEDDPASNGLSFYRPDLARQQLRSFQPYYPWKSAVSDTNPIDAEAKSTLDIFGLLSNDPGCWTPFGDPFAQMFCYFSDNLDTYIPAYPSRDYVGEIFAYNTTAASLGAMFGLLGFADDNWTDGTQSHVFMFDAPEYRDLGYGFTNTAVHEYGHHIGSSHPHDGYDSELDLDYGAHDDLQFVWAGDESHTVMSYLSVSTGFGRFDRDNMYRWETAGYLNQANALAGDIEASGQADRVRLLVLLADLQARRALRGFGEWDYLTAATNARGAYSALVVAARIIGVPASPIQATRVAPLGPPRKEGCTVRYPQV